MVGKAATAFELFIFIPVIAMVVLGLAKWHHDPFVPFVPPDRPFSQVFGVGLALGLWLYSGYEQLSTVAEEVDNPQRNYPRALALVVPLSIAVYFLPTLAALASSITGRVGKMDIFRPPLNRLADMAGQLLTIAAMVSTMALLNSTVLTTTHMPFASPKMAICHVSDCDMTLWNAVGRILISAAIYASLALHTLGQLISVYVWFRAATTVMTVLSAWGLRHKRPDLPRAFRIPAGSFGLVYVIALPTVMTIIALYFRDPVALRWGPWALAVGPSFTVVKLLKDLMHLTIQQLGRRLATAPSPRSNSRATPSPASKKNSIPS
jgi:amino acid transporter